MKSILSDIKSCRVCENFLTPNPILSVSKDSMIIIIGQAPGRIVHETGIPWNDRSGDNLRSWLGVTKDIFYDNKIFGLMPMGFCYPGKSKSGDLPPRPECAPLWHNKIIKQTKSQKMVVLIGQYSQSFYLKNEVKETLTDTIKNFKNYLPDYFVLPHPSPRNNIWMAKNKWFEKDVLPSLRNKVSSILKAI